MSHSGYARITFTILTTFNFFNMRIPYINGKRKFNSIGALQVLFF